MSQLLNKKVISPSRRGLTFSYDGMGGRFEAGKGYKYVIASGGNKLLITPTEDDEHNKVSRKKAGTKVKSLIDLRSKAVKALMATAASVEIYIYDDRIVVKVIAASGEEGYIELDGKFLEDFHFSQILLPSLDLAHALEIVSMFSGAGLLDVGFTKGNPLEVVFAIDYNEAATKTYRHNLGDHVVHGSVYDYDIRSLPRAKILMGGPSCKPYSSVRCDRTRIAASDHYEADNLDAYINWALNSSNSYDVAVIENVPGFKTMDKGYHFNKLMSAMGTKFRDVSYGIVRNDFLGGFQKRSRFIAVFSNIGKIEVPVERTREAGTVAEAFAKITDDYPNRDDQTISSERVRKRLSYVPQGGNYMSIPEELRSRGKFADTYKRLSYDEPSCTIVNWRKCIIAPPVGDRVLSVAEAAVLQGLDSTFEFVGRVSDMQQQVANGVPIEIGMELGKRVYEQIKAFYKPFRYTQEVAYA